MSTAIQHRESIIEQLSKGLRLSDIAPALNVSTNAISKVLKSDPEYRAAIEAGFHVRLDQAEDAIEEAEDNVDVARARARFQSVAWRAEREFSETWGAKSEVKHTGGVGVTIEHELGARAIDLLRALSHSPRTVEHEIPLESKDETTGGDL